MDNEHIKKRYDVYWNKFVGYIESSSIESYEFTKESEYSLDVTFNNEKFQVEFIFCKEKGRSVIKHKKVITEIEKGEIWIDLDGILYPDSQGRSHGHYKAKHKSMNISLPRTGNNQKDEFCKYSIDTHRPNFHTLYANNRFKYYIIYRHREILNQALWDNR